jgi:hypothetical protein
LKKGLFPEPSDNGLYIAIDALLVDGLIEAHCMRQGSRNEIVDVAWVQLTARGRDTIAGRNQPNSSSVFHGDQINVHGPVAAVGRNSQGVLNINNSWNQVAQSIDLPKLASELEQLRVEFRRVAATREDDRQVLLLGEAAEAAEQGDGGAAVQILSKLGGRAFELATKIGAEIIASTIAKIATGG